MPADTGEVSGEQQQQQQQAVGGGGGAEARTAAAAAVVVPPGQGVGLAGEAAAAAGGGQGLGLGFGLGLGLGLGQGQGQGAPEGFRPPRLRMFSNPGTLSNPGGSRAAVARYNDKRQSYKFSDRGALTLKNYGIRIGRGGVRDYSEEVLSPTGHNGNGTVGPFFSSSGGGDMWVSIFPPGVGMGGGRGGGRVLCRLGR